jgi:hypothetical protein
MQLSTDSTTTQIQSHVTTDGQSVSLSWCQTPSGAQDQIFITVTKLRICWCGAPSLTPERVCRLQLLLALASADILGSESRRTHDNILLPQIRDSLRLEGQVPIFISPRNKVAQLYPQALGSVFDPASTRRTAHSASNQPTTELQSSLYSPGTDRTENVSSVIACSPNNMSTELFPSNGCCTVVCLHSCYLAMGLRVTISESLLLCRSYMKCHQDMTATYRCIEWVSSPDISDSGHLRTGIPLATKLVGNSVGWKLLISGETFKPENGYRDLLKVIHTCA